MAQDSKPRLVSAKYMVPFVLVTSLFFMWGFARAILDVLNKHFQMVMDISISESAKVQATTYIGYFLMAIPAGMIISRWGYRRGVVTGLLFFGLGSLLFIPAESAMSFNFFLFALFIIGCGLVMLETAANPYVTELGAKETAASRLNLAQSFNGLGCILAPVIVGTMVFGGGEGSLSLPYTLMGVIVLLVALVFCKVKLPEINAVSDMKENDANIRPVKALGMLVRTPMFMLGVAALFFYEIAEISINSFFINYATADDWMTPTEAATVLSICGLGLFMLARVVGSWLMSHVAAEKVLTVCGVMTVVGALLVALNVGFISRTGLFMCYAFEAIMFPTVFAITIQGLGGLTKMGSSILMMTPLGGAVGTMLMGYVAEETSMATAFVVPAIGYAVVLGYALLVVLRKK